MVNINQGKKENVLKPSYLQPPRSGPDESSQGEIWVRRPILLSSTPTIISKAYLSKMIYQCEREVTQHLDPSSHLNRIHSRKWIRNKRDKVMSMSSLSSRDVVGKLDDFVVKRQKA